jgi:hypothetical protein
MAFLKEKEFISLIKQILLFLEIFLPINFKVLFIKEKASPEKP